MKVERGVHYVIAQVITWEEAHSGLAKAIGLSAPGAVGFFLAFDSVEAAERFANTRDIDGAILEVETFPQRVISEA